MYKIYCLNNISPVGLELLTDNYEITDNIEEADAIVVRSANMHEMDIPAQLKAVARAGAGVNNIPLEKLAEAGIPVFNTPGANANAVKELVIAGMLLASRDIIGGVEWCKEHADDPDIAKDAEKAKKAFAGTEISGKVLGIIGLGAIGRLLVPAAEALGMDVIGYDPFLTPEAAAGISENMDFVEDLNALLSGSDFVSIHVPATADTKGMIDAEAIATMKDGAVFLNFARDTLVNNEAMAAALADGKIRTYVTDIATPEVMKMEHAIVLPHLGASTEEAEDNCAKMAVAEIMDYLENGKKVHCVNMK